jgi:thioredoxin 1
MSDEDPELERIRRKRLSERIKALEEPAEKKPAGGIITLSDDDFKEMMGRYDILIVDFWAEWCMPCHAMSPILEDLVKKHPDVTVGKMNVDMNPRTPAEFGISGIPTLIFFKGGTPVNKVVGVVPLGNLDKIVKAIKTSPQG